MDKASTKTSVLQHCSINAFTSPSVLNALREMAARNHERAVSDAIDLTLNSASNEQEEREQEDAPRSRTANFPMFANVSFSPLASAEDQRNHADVSGSLNDSLSSPLFQGLNLPSNGSNSSPEQQPPHGVEASIQSEVEALSIAERQQVENDVQGTNPTHCHHASLGHTVSGEPQRLIAMELDSLHREFQQLVHTRPDLKILVPALENDYVKDPQLRLKMLRAENYDVRMAALRLANFLTLLQESFGPYLLMRPIQLADLTPEERQLQRKGFQQLFKFRDQTGRRIIGCFDVHIPPAVSFESQLRVVLYLVQVASDDEETQKQGLVVIKSLLKQLPPLQEAAPTDLTNDGGSRWTAFAQVLNRVFQCAPVRVGALHLCSPHDHDVETARVDFLNEFSSKERVRTRFHKGTSMELSMALSGYGIPTDRLPLKYDGSIKVEDHLQWIAVREAKEDAFRAGRVFDVVECPMNMDVLSGRGQVVRSHPGNVSFRKDFIQPRSARYNAAQSRDEKNEIADEILRDIAGLSRQFLKQHPSGYWTELEHRVAKEKVMMAFREYRKSQKLEESRSNSKSHGSNASAVPISRPHPIPPFPPQHHYSSAHPQSFSYHHPAAYPPPFLPYPVEYAASAALSHHPHHSPLLTISNSNVSTSSQNSPGRRTRLPHEDQVRNSSHKRYKRDSV